MEANYALFHGLAGHQVMGCGKQIGPYPCCSVVQGDCLELMKSLPDGCVDAVITDPPYNLSAETRDIELAGRSAMKREFGDWDTEWSPAELLVSSHRLLRKGGSLLAFCSDRLISEYRHFDKMQPRGTIVWQKDNPAPHPRPSYVSATEWIVWLQKPGAAAVWNGGGYVLNVLKYPVCAGDERTEHPTQKPAALMAELVARHSAEDSSILDPFCGSGTTLVAAKKLGRHYLGFEISGDYCQIARDRIARIEAQPNLFEKKAEQIELL